MSRNRDHERERFRRKKERLENKMRNAGRHGQNHYKVGSGKLYTRIIEKFRLSLVVKITAVYALKIIHILTVLSFMIIMGFFVYSGYQAEQSLNRNILLVQDYLDNSAGNALEAGNRIKRLANLSELEITVFNNEMKPLYGTASFYQDNNKRGWFQINNEYLLILNKLPKNFDLKWNENYKKYNFGFELAQNKKVKVNDAVYYIQASTKMIGESIAFFVLCMLLLLVNFLFTLNVILSGARAARKTLKPIEIMTKTVENITVNVLDTRLDIKGSQDELKDLAKTFNQMLDRIQLSYEQQNQFVSDASHELRTPIAVIQGYANMLDRWGKNDEQILQESITAIKGESNSMKELIENLLFLARGDKNTQKVEKVDFNLQEVMDEIVKETRMIDERHTFENEYNPGILVNGDKGLIKEAIRILVDNSIKYTPDGGVIRLNAYLKDQKALITVEDNGAGISKEDLPFIFDRFYRADKSRTKETGGTGLGLAIAKWIILRHNGKLEVQSELNKGTIVSISLPCLDQKPLL